MLCRVVMYLCACMHYIFMHACMHSCMCACIHMCAQGENEEDDIDDEQKVEDIAPATRSPLQRHVPHTLMLVLAMLVPVL